MGLLTGAMACDLRPVAAAAHAAPFPLARGRGVLEYPATLGVFADFQAGGGALDQLACDRLRQPRGRAVNRVALVPVAERDPVWSLYQLVHVMGAQRAVDLREVGRVRALTTGLCFEHTAHRLADAPQPAQHRPAGARRILVAVQEL